LSYKEIISQLEPKKGVPISVFSKKLGALESIVKFLVEERKLSYKEIAKVLNRDPRTIWSTYDKAKKKLPSQLDVSSQTYLPLEIFADRNLSVLESIVYYLKTEVGMSLHEISEKLERGKSTIWTVYDRAKKKA